MLNVDEGIKLLRDEFGIGEDEGELARGELSAFASEQINRP